MILHSQVFDIIHLHYYATQFETRPLYKELNKQHSFLICSNCVVIVIIEINKVENANYLCCVSFPLFNWF